MHVNGGYVCMCVCMWNPEFDTNSFLDQFPPYMLKAGSLTWTQSLQTWVVYYVAYPGDTHLCLLSTWCLHGCWGILAQILKPTWLLSHPSSPYFTFNIKDIKKSIMEEECNFSCIKPFDLYFLNLKYHKEFTPLKVNITFLKKFNCITIYRRWILAIQTSNERGVTIEEFQTTMFHSHLRVKRKSHRGKKTKTRNNKQSLNNDLK